MKYRTLGNTGLKVSELGFGCGNVGGLLVRGDRKTMIDTVARAIELGITYFDTAPLYGDGKSETNLGWVLKELKADVIIGTKVMLPAADMQHIEKSVVESVNRSLNRLEKQRVDLIQLHNRIDLKRRPDERCLGLEDLRPVIHAFQSLREQGKVRFWGVTGLGTTEALHQAVDTNSFHTIQTCYNLLNPSAGKQVSRVFPFQDYRKLIERASDKRMGAIAIRILAAGALSGATERHPIALPSVPPIASGPQYEEDVEQSRCFGFLVDEGYTHNLVEAAIRFVISKAGISTALIGISSSEQLHQAVEYTNKGPLPADALDRIDKIHESGH
jgi:aryl-alcohol dehydrogenase-like predicted oxidoreductase